MGLAGESGCGKSTLGKSLIRLDGRMRYVGGQVVLDGKELPIWDDDAMNAFRFREVSIVPQYAMSALNPIRKIGRMIRELLRARGVDADARAARARAAPRAGRPRPRACSISIPIELSGGMKQRVVMVISTLLDPSLLIADEITSALDVSTQRGGRGDAGRVPGPRLRQEHDLRHPRHRRPVPGRGHDPRHVRGQARREGAGRGDRLESRATRTRGCSSRRCPRSESGTQSGSSPASRAGRRELLDPPTGCRFRDRCPLATARCAEEPPWVEEGGRGIACWEATPAPTIAAPVPVEAR